MRVAMEDGDCSGVVRWLRGVGDRRLTGKRRGVCGEGFEFGIWRGEAVGR